MTARRLLARRCLLAPLAATALALAVPPAPVAAAPTDPAPLLLRLPDLPPGYEVAMDDLPGAATGPNRCDVRQLGDLSTHDDLATLAKRYPHRGCEISFFQTWAAPGLAPSPFSIGSSAFAFTDPAGAQAALQDGQTVAAGVLDIERRWLTPLPATTTVGDETQVFGYYETGAVVLWRSGAVLGIVLAMGTSQQFAVPSALQLAAAQQARIASPSPLRHADLDDLEVPLADPRLDVPVRWLGRALAARDGRPWLRLISITGPTYLPSEPRVELDYGSRRHSSFVSVSLWKPRQLHQLLHAQHIDERCLRRYPGGLVGTRATIVGSSTFVDEHCKRPPRHPSYYSAIAWYRDVAVTINAERWRRYDSPAGLRALLRALRPRT